MVTEIPGYKGVHEPPHNSLWNAPASVPRTGMLKGVEWCSRGGLDAEGRSRVRGAMYLAVFGKG